MYDSASYPKPSPEEIRRFTDAQVQAILMAEGASGFPTATILPFCQEDDGTFELHIVKADPTYEALKSTGRGAILVQEVFAFTPHHVVDPVYAGMATLHFRAVLYDVTVEVSEEPTQVAECLARLLERYEPGAAYHPLGDLAFYEADLARLAAVRCKVTATHVKFKTAQNRSPEERRRVTAFLRERGLPGDLRAAEIIEESGDPSGV